MHKSMGLKYELSSEPLHIILLARSALGIYIIFCTLGLLGIDLLDQTMNLINPTWAGPLANGIEK
jgi:hypothetical protein